MGKAREKLTRKEEDGTAKAEQDGENSPKLDKTSILYQGAISEQREEIATGSVVDARRGSTI